MSWKKYFKSVNSTLPVTQRTVDNTSAYASTARYSNWLPEVYSGPPDRLQRYSVYDQMNFDHEISAALDTIADFATAPDEVTQLPLVLKYNDEPTPSEVQIIEKSLGQWCRLNKISRRLWRMFRSTLIYGDQFFIRDPETFKLYWIDPAKVEKVIVNESNGKKIESYFVKDIDLNMKSLVATNQLNKLSNEAFGGNSIVFSPPMQGNMNFVSGGYGGAGTANYQDGGATAVDAEHIIQLSLTEGMNASWPFGLSILEQIYKVYKQKELLEDAILIYRVHRAPERRVFFIDVGTMPPNKAQGYLERVRYEVQQKRIPSRTGGGSSVVDSTYSPMSMLEDYFFAITCVSLTTEIPLLDGRTLTLQQLIDEFNDGKENYTYTVDQKTHKMIPGKIVWGGVTRKNAEVVEVLLDNGKTLKLTPDHRMIMRDGSEKEVKDLQTGDSLMPLYLIDAKTSAKQKGNPYLRHVDNSDEKIKWVHTTICPKSKIGKDVEIHHIDFNSRNNNPENLIEMTAEDHRRLHKDAGTYSLRKQWDNPVSRQLLIDGINNYHANRTLEDDKMLSERNSKNAIAGHASMTDEERDVWLSAMSDSQLGRDLKLQYSPLLTEYILECAKENIKDISKLEDLRDILENDCVFMGIWFENNRSRADKATHIDESLSMFTIARLREVFKLTEYNTWDAYSKEIGVTFKRFDFREGNKLVYETNLEKYNKNPTLCKQCGTALEYKRRTQKFCSSSCSSTYNNLKGVIGSKKRRETEFHNHKVVSITFLEEREDTGDITIESKGGYHNFATAAGVYIHNSEGRGSKVEVLPGGENLGCFSLDTKVRLIDGRDLSIIDVRNEIEEGKTLFTYSCHPTTGEIAPGLISGAGVTKKDAKVIKLHLSNNETITCTPEHKFPIVNVGFVEAKDLKIGTQLNTKHGNSVFLKEIEDIVDTIDVGTLMIDYHETYHNWHTYELSCGVFVKNSIDDLRYFNNKMLRALGVPSSYLPTGPEDGTASMNDGKVGTAFIQEFRFSKVVTRYQQQLIEPLDLEFKLFLKHRGVTIDNSLFELSFTPAQSFSEYRQLELDAAKINAFSALTDISFVSKRFILKRYLGWTEGELVENERMWKEERSRLTKTIPAEIGNRSAPAGLSDMGISSSSIDGMSTDDIDIEDTDENNQGSAEPTDDEIDNFGEQ
jgi:intein/homing endonuclease